MVKAVQGAIIGQSYFPHCDCEDEERAGAVFISHAEAKTMKAVVYNKHSHCEWCEREEVQADDDLCECECHSKIVIFDEKVDMP